MKALSIIANAIAVSMAVALCVALVLWIRGPRKSIPVQKKFRAITPDRSRHTFYAASFEEALQYAMDVYGTRDVEEVRDMEAS